MRSDGLDNPLEWHVVMANGVEHTDRAAESARSSDAGRTRTRSGITFVKNPITFSSGRRAVRHRRSDDDVILTGVARKSAAYAASSTIYTVECVPRASVASWGKSPAIVTS